MSNIHEQPRTLRTVADFAAVPAGQVPDCLRAFRQWLKEQAASQAVRRAPHEFVWAPPAAAPVPAGEALTPLTDISRLGLRPGAVQQFRRMNVFVLEDFSAVSLAEMGRLVNVGSTTVSRIRSMLCSVGLDFRAAEEAPGGSRRRAAAPASEAASFGDDTALAGLRLKPQTIGKLTAHGLRTVGDLRELTPLQLESLLSVRRRQEVFQLLRARGLNLRSKPSELELWRHGLLHVRDLRAPGDGDSVLSLQPWFGAAVTGAALAAGIGTAGQLGALALSGAEPPSVRGIGPYTWNQIRKFFLAARATRSAPAP